jgi:thiol-disulfide isomerase/thioredoxin
MMNNKKRTILSILVLVVFLAGAYMLYGTLQNQQDPSDGNNGDEPIMAQDFEVLDQEGNTVRLSDFQGKPIVLNFWASWCPPCIAEMPFFQNAYESLGDRVVFLMVNETDGNRETVEKAEAFLEQEGLSLPVYFDTKLEAGYVYNVTGIPVTYFIDKEGVIRSFEKGSLTEKKLLENINDIL